MHPNSSEAVSHLGCWRMLKGWCPWGSREQQIWGTPSMLALPLDVPISFVESHSIAQTLTSKNRNSGQVWVCSEQAARQQSQTWHGENFLPMCHWIALNFLECLGFASIMLQYKDTYNAGFCVDESWQQYTAIILLRFCSDDEWSRKANLFAPYSGWLWRPRVPFYLEYIVLICWLEGSNDF